MVEPRRLAPVAQSKSIGSLSQRSQARILPGAYASIAPMVELLFGIEVVMSSNLIVSFPPDCMEQRFFCKEIGRVRFPSWAYAV